MGAVGHHSTARDSPFLGAVDAPERRGNADRRFRRSVPLSVALVAVTLGVVVSATSSVPLRAGPPGAKRGAAIGPTSIKKPVGPADNPANPGAPALIPEPDQNQPDAFVFASKSGYFLYSSQTSMFTPPIVVSYSKVLGRWPSPRPAMALDPSWATPGFTWAPDVSRIDGRYVLYFDALANPSYPGAQGQCLGAATATKAVGPFVPTPSPLVCQPAFGGAIDPRTFVGPAGGHWLLWKSDENSDFQGPTDVTHLFSQRLSRNGLSVVGPQFELLSADEVWQHRIVEAPDLVEVDGTYWLFYSGGWFNKPYYAIGLARCPGPAGPCTDLSPTPWLASNTQGRGPGEESLFVDREGGTWMAYSPTALLSEASVRPVALVRVALTPAGPELLAPTLPRTEVGAARPSTGHRRACPCEVH